MFEPQAKAEEIEEVVVVAQQVKTVKADLLKESVYKSILQHTLGQQVVMVLSQGYNERGVPNSTHGSLQKMAYPNLSGSAWYDFGTDLATGQKVKVIPGAQIVLYMVAVVLLAQF